MLPAAEVKARSTADGEIPGPEIGWVELSAHNEVEHTTGSSSRAVVALMQLKHSVSLRLAR